MTHVTINYEDEEEVMKGRGEKMAVGLFFFTKKRRQQKILIKILWHLYFALILSQGHKLHIGCGPESAVQL